MLDSQSHASWLSTATALFFTWALLTLIVRIWVKLRRSENWGLDDSTITTAFAVALAHIICTFYAVNCGYGKPLEVISAANKSNIEKSLFASQLFYIISLGLTKVSSGFFIARLTRYGPQIKLAYLLAGISGIWTLVSIFVVSLRGNLSQPWATLDGTQPLYFRWLGIEIFGLLIELALWALSVNLIWGLNMNISKRVLILVAFGCRLLLIPIAAVRVHYLSPQENPHPATTSILAGVLTEAAMDYALFSASVTCLKPFLQPFHSGYIVNSVGAVGSGLRSGNRTRSAEPYYQLNTVKNTHKDGALVSVRELPRSALHRANASGSEPWRGDFAEASSTARAPGSSGVETVSSMRSSMDRAMVITETKTLVLSETRV